MCVASGPPHLARNYVSRRAEFFPKILSPDGGWGKAPKFFFVQAEDFFFWGGGACLADGRIREGGPREKPEMDFRREKPERGPDGEVQYDYMKHFFKGPQHIINRETIKNEIRALYRQDMDNIQEEIEQWA